MGSTSGAPLRRSWRQLKILPRPLCAAAGAWQRGGALPACLCDDVPIKRQLSRRRHTSALALPNSSATQAGLGVETQRCRPSSSRTLWKQWAKQSEAQQQQGARAARATADLTLLRTPAPHRVPARWSHWKPRVYRFGPARGGRVARPRE